MTETLEKKNYFQNNFKGMEYFLENKTEMKTILEGFLYETETMLFYGASGSGKSLFSYALAQHLSDASFTPDNDFMGIPCAQDLKVLYADGEMHVNSIASRVESLGSGGFGMTYFAAADVGRSINLANEVQAKHFIDAVKDGGFKLVVLDSIRTLFDLTDENNAEAWKPVNDFIMRLRSAGAGVIAIHHTTKDAFKAGGEVIWSGSSNAVTVFDRTCGIERTGGDSGYWNLAVGHKEGRSGTGWSDEIKSLCFTVGDNGLEKVDHIDEKLKDLISWFDWLDSEQAEFATTKEKLSDLNKRINLGIGNNPTIKAAWEEAQGLFELWNDNYATDSNKIDSPSRFKQVIQECSL